MTQKEPSLLCNFNLPILTCYFPIRASYFRILTCYRRPGKTPILHYCILLLMFELGEREEIEGDNYIIY